LKLASDYVGYSCFREISSSNPGRNTGYSVVLRGFSSVVRNAAIVKRLGHCRFLQSPLKFFNNLSFKHSILYLQRRKVNHTYKANIASNLTLLTRDATVVLKINRINTKRTLLLTSDSVYSDVRFYRGSENLGGAP